jgi:hypothetical protein
MKEKTLLKIAVIGSLVGIFLLYLISENIKIDQTSVSNIEQENIGTDILLKAQVSDVYNQEGFSIITVIQPKEVQIIAYDNVSLKIGQEIEVIGEIDEYEGEKQIVANRIRVIS